MIHNVGTIDSIIRIILGLILIGWGIYTQMWWGAIGIIPLVTASLHWCPLYLPLGLNTKSQENIVNK
jgi:hypothetical protein